MTRLQDCSATRAALVPEGPLPALEPGVAKEVFFICREALTHVARHAQATQVELGWRSAGAAAWFTVVDDGSGLEALAATSDSAIGLIGMHERARLCGGTLSFEPNLPQGTRVTVQVPCSAPCVRPGQVAF